VPFGCGCFGRGFDFGERTKWMLAESGVPTVADLGLRRGNAREELNRFCYSFIVTDNEERRHAVRSSDGGIDCEFANLASVDLHPLKSVAAESVGKGCGDRIIARVIADEEHSGKTLIERRAFTPLKISQRSLSSS